jgi:hypothetical protein
MRDCTSDPAVSFYAHHPAREEQAVSSNQKSRVEGASPAERAREAWESYRIACVDVDVADYEETEMIAWDLLQHELRELAAERDELDTAAAMIDRAA